MTRSEASGGNPRRPDKGGGPHPQERTATCTNCTEYVRHPQPCPRVILYCTPSIKQVLTYLPKVKYLACLYKYVPRYMQRAALCPSRWRDDGPPPGLTSHCYGDNPYIISFHPM